MGKDREGKKYHSPNVDAGSPEQYLEIADKYAVDETGQGAHGQARHPNRNVDKRESRPSQKSNRYGTRLADRSTTVPQEFLALSKDVFAELANFTSSCCVSIYLPTHQAGVEVNEQQDAIAFKSVLQQIQSALKAKGVEQAMVDRFLEPGYVLLKNEKFWFDLTKGLAVFMSDGYLKYYRMPFEPKKELLINTSFLVSPLVPVVTNADYFYLLVLSKKQAKLFRGDVFGLTPIPIAEMPNGVDDVVHFEEKDGQNLWRTESSGAGEGANYHGAGGGKPEDKDNIALYLDEVEETAWKEVLHTENVPLLLAGVEYLLPIFRKVTSYNHVWEEVITGNHDHDDIHSLHQKALEKIAPYFQQRVQRALADYGNHLASGRATSFAEDIIPAAYYSRVARLFAAKGEHIWGTFDAQNNLLAIHGTQREGDECLLDKAVIKTLLNGGEVFFLEREKMPAASKLAALMRY